MDQRWTPSTLGAKAVNAAFVDAQAEASSSQRPGLLLIDVKATGHVLKSGQTELLDAVQRMNGQAIVRDMQLSDAVVCRGEDKACWTVDKGIFIQIDSLSIVGGRAIVRTRALGTVQMVAGRSSICERRLLLELVENGPAWSISNQRVLSTC